MKICFKMKNHEAQLVNTMFILSEARLGKKYGKPLAQIYISNPQLRNGDFPAILGHYVNFVNSFRLMKNRHNDKCELKRYRSSKLVILLLDVEDSKIVKNLENELGEKYPTPTINSGIELEKWSDFISEKKHKPVNELIEKLYEQEAK